MESSNALIQGGGERIYPWERPSARVRNQQAEAKDGLPKHLDIQSRRPHRVRNKGGQWAEDEPGGVGGRGTLA